MRTLLNFNMNIAAQVRVENSEKQTSINLHQTSSNDERICQSQLIGAEIFTCCQKHVRTLNGSRVRM